MVAPFWNAKGVVFTMSEFGSSVASGPAPRVFAPRIVATNSAKEGETFAIAELGLEQMDAAQREWSDLAERALEPNAFYEPGFALAAARHFPIKARPRFIVVWDERSLHRRMMGFFPIVTPHPLLGDGLIRLWLHKQAALATPLVDRDDAVAALIAFLDWIEARSVSNGVVFTRMPSNEKFHEALVTAVKTQSRSIKILDSYERAALLPGGEANALCEKAGSKKKLNELQRLRRRLDERGALTFDVQDSPRGVRAAAEEFLALEASGWKAGRGALLSQPSLATFLRSATRMLARQGRCKIISMRLDGKPIAMGIMLESQSRSYYWKIAFDESYRSQAPGIQLAFEQTRAQLMRDDIELTDSCAIANHPMIDKLWPDRIGVCDIAVQLQRGREPDFLRSCRKAHLRRQIRDIAKMTSVRLLNRKVV